MLQVFLHSSRSYYIWILCLSGIIGVCGLAYEQQLINGLGITGMNRDVSWGFYISQFTYLVGVAASAVVLVIPAYFHHYQHFKRLIIFGEFMAVATLSMCLMFIVADLGQPQRLLNVLLYPAPNSVMFYDMIALLGYLVLNIAIGWTALVAERHEIPPPRWLRPLICLSIFLAISLHTLTAFIYAGLPGRHYWLTAVMAARFLASAFCSGPALLLLFMFVLRRLSGFDPGQPAVQTLVVIIVYAMCCNVFLYLTELFTAFYSNIPGYMSPIIFLFSGQHAHSAWLACLMWGAAVLSILSLGLLIPPRWRTERLLPFSLGMLVTATWLDKGFGLVVGGFNPNMYGSYTPYTPTVPEIMVGIGVYAWGLLVLSLLWKMALSVKKESSCLEYNPEPN